MKCPCCGWQVQPSWQKLWAITDNDDKPLPKPIAEVKLGYVDLRFKTGESYSQQIMFAAWWMQCPNVACQEVLLMVGRRHDTISSIDQQNFKIWYAIPKKLPPRPVAPEVPEPYKSDYIEAARILEDSPRMSAVLSRRILTDLLAEYANLKGYKLSKQTEKVAADATYPTPLRDNVEHFREIADFGAHTQKDETGAIIDVTPEEAEWTLELLDGFFDYFIVARERDKKRRTNFDKKVEQAGRKSIVKPGDD